jgi:hypothetical protein
MALVSTILAATGYRLAGGITIGASSDPSQAACIQWLNEIALWITGICAEQDSDLGRTIGTITTVTPTITVLYNSTSPTIFTAVGHGLSSTDEILIKNSDYTELNDKEWTFTKISPTSGSVPSDSSDHDSYGFTGDIYKRKYSELASYIYAPAQTAWIVEGHSRDELRLRDQSCLLEYDPIEIIEPTEFYIDGANNVCFPSYPDDVYTVKVPYWTIPTALTTTTETMPFLGLMDNVFIEALTIRAQNRDEYDTTVDLKWLGFLNERVRNVIAMRKSMKSRVSV